MRRPKLREVLAPLPRHQLSAIAEAIGVGSTRNFIPEITACLTDPVALENVVSRLDEKAKKLLVELTLIFEDEPPEPPESIKSSDEIMHLAEHGFVSMGKSYWGAPEVHLPLEVTRLLQERFLKQRAAEGEGLLVESMETVVSGAASFLRNVSTLISLADDRGLPLTQTGDVHKQFVRRQLIPFLEFTSEDKAHDRYPPDLADALLFCRFFELLEANDGMEKPTPTAFSFLIANEDDVKDALSCFLHYDEGEAPSEWIHTFLLNLPDPENWYPTGELIEKLTSTVYEDERREEIKSDWGENILRAVRLGLLESGTRDGTDYVRLGLFWSPTAMNGADTKDLFITPDFKLSAPRNLSFSVRHYLFRFARFVKADVMDQWEITRDSISTAVDEGISSNDIVGFLTEHAATPVPKNVSDTIGLWEKERRNLRHFYGTVLVADDPLEQRLIGELLSNKDALLERPAANVFLLHPDRADEALDELRKRKETGAIQGRREKKTDVEFAVVLEKKKTR